MEAHHEYRVNAFGAGGRNGVVHAEGVLSCISFSAPPELLGEPGRWTPEHFLVAAVASCFVSTFSGIAEKSRLGFSSFNLDAEGVLGNEDGIGRFTEIKLRPVVTVLKEEDRDRAIHLLEKADKIVPHRAVSSIQSRPPPYCEDRRGMFCPAKSSKD